jgi:hypothetical protein
MPQSFIKMMRRQKNSLPEKEKNTDGEKSNRYVGWRAILI